jgi:hypothetical protein
VFSRHVARNASFSLVALVSLAACLSTPVAIAQVPAAASASIANFDPRVIGDTRGRYGAPAVIVDTNGNAVDAHDGVIRYFAGRYYWYGTAYRCGFALWGLTGDNFAPGRPTFCGMAAYSSTDLVTWRDEGMLFDGSTPYWQAACGTGCFSPKVLFDPARNRYVLWVNALNGQVTYRVLTSKSPAGPFTDVKEPSVGPKGGDYDIFVDRDATGWMAKTEDLGIVIWQLSGDYTTGVGTSVRVTLPTPDLSCLGQVFCALREGPSLFRRGNSYYLVISDPACPYCQAGTAYYMARSPGGPWKGPNLLALSTPLGATGLQQADPISYDSCGGQPRSVSELPTPAGSVFVYWSDLWRGATRQLTPGGPFPVRAADGNQGPATKFLAPLRFGPDGRIRWIDCTSSAQVPLATGLAASPTPTTYQTACAISQGQSVLQELRPLAQPISGVRVTLYKYADPDAFLSYSISARTAAGASTVTLGELPAGAVSSAPRAVVLPISAPANSALTMTLHSSSQRGCYGVLLANTADPAAGIYLGPVAGRRTVTRAVGMLATPVPSP